MTSDYDLLLRGVLTHPADDLRRLVLADWLDENGQGDRAEFVRVQCEYQGLHGHLAAHGNDSCEVCVRGYHLSDLLLDKYRVPRNKPAPFARDCPSRLLDLHDRTMPRIEWDWHRGFVAEVRLTLAQFAGGPCPECVRGYVSAGPDSHWCRDCKGTGRVAGCAEAMFRAHPVTSVTLSCRRADEIRHGDIAAHRCWFTVENAPERADPAWLPADLFRRLTGGDIESEGLTAWRIYPSRIDADAARSQACVSHGRELAGLPPLPTPAATTTDRR